MARDEGSIPFTRSTDNQVLTRQCSKSAVNRKRSSARFQHSCFATMERHVLSHAQQALRPELFAGGFCAHGKGYAVFVLRHPERRGTVEEGRVSLGNRVKKFSAVKQQRRILRVTCSTNCCGLMRAFFFLKLLPFPGQRHSLVDVGTGRQRFVEGIRRAWL